MSFFSFFAVLSIPQAAQISSPRDARMVANTPWAVSQSRNSVILSSCTGRNGLSGMAWNRIRFTRQLRPLNALTSWRASSIESFTPWNIVYSNDRRRWWLKSYRRRTSSISVMEKAFSAGISWRRFSGVGACKLTAIWQSQPSIS